MLRFLLSSLFICLAFSLTAQEKPNPKTKVETPDPKKEVEKGIEKEIILEEESSKSFKMEEEMEAPQKGEPVIGTEVFIEQETIGNQPTTTPEKKKGKKKKANAKKEDNK